MKQILGYMDYFANTDPRAFCPGSPHFCCCSNLFYRAGCKLERCIGLCLQEEGKQFQHLMQLNYSHTYEVIFSNNFLRVSHSAFFFL